MKFSFRISEQEFLQACRLRGNKAWSGIGKTILFWFFVLVCLTLLYGVVSKSRQVTEPVPETDHTEVFQQALFNIVPFVMLAGCWVFIFFYMAPAKVKRLYRRDPVMQAEFTAELAADGLTMWNTAGIEARYRWAVFENWSDGKQIVLLNCYPGTYFILSLQGLDEGQQAELRNLLQTVLPKK